MILKLSNIRQISIENIYKECTTPIKEGGDRILHTHKTQKTFTMLYHHD